MPFSSGTFTPYTPGNPVVTGTTISSTVQNNTVNDIATGLSTCILKDGTQTVTANIPMAGFRITNVGITGIAGSVGTPSVNFSESSTGFYKSAAGGIGVASTGVQVAAFSGGGLAMVGNVTFTDNTYDIGASGATRPRTGYFGTSVVTPTLTATTAVTTPSITINSGTALTAYSVSTYTATATGMTTSPTGSVKYTLVGNSVTLDIPAISGTSNITAFTLTGAPAAIRPAGTKEFVVRVKDNGGNYVFGLGSMDSSGVITLFLDPNGTMWTNSGTKAINSLSVSYTLA